MKIAILFAALWAMLAASLASAQATATDFLVPGFRPPSIPVIVLSPTISMWANTDTLTDDFIHHWSGSTMAMVGLVNVDGTVYRFLGPQPSTSTALPTANLIVTPTQTLAVYEGAGIQLNLTFSQAAFPDDLTYFSRPYAYVTVTVASIDNNKHSVQIYLDHAADVVVNSDSTKVDWFDDSSSYSAGENVLRFGTYDQIPFMNRGDGTKNEWGYVLFGTNSPRLSTRVQAYTNDARAAFAANEPLPTTDNRKPREAQDDWPGSIYVLSYTVTPGSTVSDFFVFAFDEVYTMYYFHDYQVPYWQYLYDNDRIAMMQAAFADYNRIIQMCNAFDAKSLAQLTAAGGNQYATFTALAHRQATGATVVTWNSIANAAWAYMKEISSDGDISTVDVIFPASPFFALYGPELLRLVLIPVLEYGMNNTDIDYRLQWAPHHLGAWPVADIIGEEQEQMPMEESANMLIMLAIIAQRQNYNVSWIQAYMPALQLWADYLNSSLPDPGNQLCTDDFEGPSPHNANLALKGIIGLASYSLLLNYTGNSSQAAVYMSAARGFVQDWLSMALDDSGDHYRLQFDLKNTWSTKYNLMWQFALGLDLFPSSVAQMELKWYLAHAQQYGVPLDNRSYLLKCDWLSWAATFGGMADAQTLYGYLYNFANTSPSRTPFSDYYNSSTNAVIGFTARPVMGGLYARVLVNDQQARLGLPQRNTPSVQSQNRHPRLNKFLNF